MKPEDNARKQIDELLRQAGWAVCDPQDAHISAHRGVAIREFPLKSGHGFADYLLYVDGKAAGVIEAKKAGVTLSGVEIQSDRYSQGLPDGLPRWADPLPFAYQSTGIETRFTNGFDPQPKARSVFAFHRPELFTDWLSSSKLGIAETAPSYLDPGKTFLARLQHLPPLVEEGLWPAQIKAITNLEQSLRDDRPRALIQMATGSGKTFTAISFLYRLIKFAGARRVLFLVDRGNLADQTLKEFQQYNSPYNNFKFIEEYIVQRLSGNTLDTTARVCICTIQRLYAMLKGSDLPEDLEEMPAEDLGGLFKRPDPIEYNPKLPIETFDIIVTDEAHRSIYKLWAQVLEYFDAYLIGLTATPGKQTFGFFHQNLVMEYNHEMAVADGVNVNYDVYRIRTAITEQGSKVEAGYSVQIQERETRKKRWEQLDDDFAYDPNQLDRDVVAPDQIRKIIQTYRDKLFTEIFPDRTWVPKTLIFAKDDAHAENIVEIVREEFGKGNDFAQKITYRTTGAKPKDLINEFRTSPMPRVAVTVDMIATGTDIKAVEVVFFLRAVKSRAFFEQMKGRGVRIISADDLQSVTPDARAKDHFVIVDAVGVCEQDKTDSRPMEQKPTVSFEKLLQAVAFGNTEDEVLTSLAGRLARMEHRITAENDQRIREATGGIGLKDLAHGIIAALDPDEHPTPEAHRQAIETAVRPLHDPKVRELLAEIKRQDDIIIDTVSADEVLEAGFSADALDRARGMVQSFEQFIAEHKDEITALQILFNRPYRQRLDFKAVRELADAIEKPPYLWNESQLWSAYAALEKSKVKGASGRRILTDLVSLVRFAIHQDNELIPFPERVNANFKAWLALQGQTFTPEQLLWLEMIRDHIAGNLGIEPDDFEYAPFAQQGGLGKVHQLFGEKLNAIIEELNETLAA
ncbi:DEAD/DEAH box helicase family protein [Acidithiobacillus sp. CV18-2]|uniref:DEAD/DEAH box helicase family protein n=1 Tax=Igneacidithiobacillus copahuensis TaxID=2724909 RepID=A0AAE2YPW6_9PROT|nr:type I restriction-modification enzyme R subunit C-terminal domain-containing protein [Igneacidithiobacillus copahuensis]MBU2753554.1 DEAD/DEAH box helicase family protein [Acidithiobacillus sp. CV18-3]MBU2757373.1 DEAD/DEAH box helicase family protein [Acidithiobacillus sp. BN09-2]MBU2776048.1 DEAD/DEAH box helicase family protein [Acidithiobacillus sp. CV18-2]MBU2795339.1 DEAD/DEAH box helicase family protein [Acidithiobacillus sp. VAN18-2]MBU2800275.1 DEAD/DEAH box helicase family protei